MSPCECGLHLPGQLVRQNLRGDMAHEEAGAAVQAYAQGIGLYASELGSLPDVATLVGAMILARATAGTELSDRILDEVRAKLVSGA